MGERRWCRDRVLRVSVVAGAQDRTGRQAQREGPNIGWLPKQRIESVLARGDFIEKRLAEPCEPNTLYVGWRGDNEGRALSWWPVALR
jgi:hypothetical protein